MSRDEPAVLSRRRRVARRVSGFVLDYLIALPVGCVAGLLWANTLPDSYFQFARSTTFLVNDVGFVFFFALITKEVAEATLPGGALHPWRRAALPVAVDRRLRPGGAPRAGDALMVERESDGARRDTGTSAG